jgi:hypothetical protein
MNRKERTGNWTPDGSLERAILRREYKEQTPAERVEQVSELSRVLTQLAREGLSQRSA